MTLLALLLQHDHSAMGHQFVSESLSVFKHNIAGVLVILAGLFFFLEQTRMKEKKWVRYGFPVMVIIVSLGVMFFSRPNRIWWFDFEQLRRSSEALQHKLFALGGIIIGLVELFRRTGRLKNQAWAHILNAIIITSGILLYIHGGHNELIAVSHFWMALSIFLIGMVKTVTDIRPGALAWMRMYVLPALFLWLGLLLVLYIEIEGQRPFQM